MLRSIFAGQAQRQYSHADEVGAMNPFESSRQHGANAEKARKGEGSARSQAMPTQMSEGWNAVVGDFFNSRNMSPQEVQKRLHDLLMRSTSD